MKLGLISALILALLTAASCFAQDAAPITEATFLGGSIVNRAKPEVVALTCVNFEETNNALCKTVRFTYYNGEKTQYLGAEISLDH